MTTLPEYWTGVDAAAFPEGRIKLDWQLIGETLDECDGNPIEAYNLLSNLAIDARIDGELHECSYLTSHGLAALNYGDLLK